MNIENQVKTNCFSKKIRIDAQYISHNNQNISLEPEIYTQDKMKLVGLRTQFYSVDSEKNNIAGKLPPRWDEFIQKIDEIDNRVSGICYGLVQQTASNTDRLEYCAGIEVDRADKPPTGMVSIDTPKSRYAKFTYRCPAKQLNNTVNYIYSTWLLQSSMPIPTDRIWNFTAMNIIPRQVKLWCTTPYQ